MAEEPKRPLQPKDIQAGVDDMVRIWRAMADNSVDIAKAKRTMFRAYLDEGFTEQQALELLK